MCSSGSKDDRNFYWFPGFSVDLCGNRMHRLVMLAAKMAALAPRRPPISPPTISAVDCAQAAVWLIFLRIPVRVILSGLQHGHLRGAAWIAGSVLHRAVAPL